MGFMPKGILPPMVTPLTEDGKVSEKGLRKLVSYLIEGGVHGIFAIGTTGEFYGLNKDQYRQALEITLDETAGRVPVLAGANAIATKEAIALAEIAQDVGVDAISALTPYFMNFTQDEIYDHFMTIARSTDLPVILYNNRPRTSININPETASKLADVENIVGIKDSTGDFTNTAEYIRLTSGKKFNVLVGKDPLIHATLCYGGSGSVCGTANVAPKLCADIYDKFVAGDLKGSLEDQLKVNRLRMAFDIAAFPTSVKAALELLGIDAGPCIAPSHRLTMEQNQFLKKMLIETGVLK
jgi:4-hydroxy-tetrahydrodipicolinate synthase